MDRPIVLGGGRMHGLGVWTDEGCMDWACGRSEDMLAGDLGNDWWHKAEPPGHRLACKGRLAFLRTPVLLPAYNAIPSTTRKRGTDSEDEEEGGKAELSVAIADAASEPHRARSIAQQPNHGPRIRRLHRNPRGACPPLTTRPSHPTCTITYPKRVRSPRGRAPT